MAMPTDGIQVPSEWNEITSQIIGAAVEVHASLGPGLLESLYEQALVHEIRDRSLRIEQQRPIRLRYKAHEIGNLRIDLVVEEIVIVELECIERVALVHGAQLLSYLRSADLPLGLLINFHHVLLTDGITRRINPHCSRLKVPSNPLR